MAEEPKKEAPPQQGEAPPEKPAKKEAPSEKKEAAAPKKEEAAPKPKEEKKGETPAPAGAAPGGATPAATKKRKLPKGRHASAIKRQRQAEKRTVRNTEVRSQVRTIVRKTREAVESGQGERARELLAHAMRTLDRASAKGVIHRRQASRRIARLSRLVKGPHPSPQT